MLQETGNIVTLRFVLARALTATQEAALRTEIARVTGTPRLEVEVEVEVPEDE